MPFPYVAGEQLLADDLNTIVEASGAGVFTSGEAVAAGKAVFIDDDGKYYKTDVAVRGERLRQIAFSAEAAAGVDELKKLIFKGIISGLTLGDQTESVAATGDAAQSSTADILGTIYSGQLAHRAIFYTGTKQGNISKIRVYLDTKTGSGADVRVRVYEADVDGVKTGSPIFEKTVAAASLTATAYNDFIPATKPSVTPRTLYILEVEGTSGNGSNLWQTRGESTGTQPTFIRGNISTGNTWAGNTIAFSVEHDVQRNYYIGDNVYLSIATPGDIQVAEPNTAGDAAIPVGIILSDTQILVSPEQYRGQLIARMGVQCASVSGSQNGFRFPAPRDWRKAIVTFDNNPSGGALQMSTIVVHRLASANTFEGSEGGVSKGEASAVQYTQQVLWDNNSFSPFNLQCLQTLSTSNVALTIHVSYYR